MQRHQHYVSISTLLQLLFIMITRWAQEKEFIWNLLHSKHLFTNLWNVPFQDVWGRGTIQSVAWGICPAERMKTASAFLSIIHACCSLAISFPWIVDLHDEALTWLWWGFLKLKGLLMLKSYFCLLLSGMHLFEGCKLLEFVVNLKS